MNVTDPSVLNEHFNDLFRQGRLEPLSALYEAGAVIRLPDGTHISGQGRIKTYLAQLLTLRGRLVVAGQACIQHGELALLTADWNFEGEDAEGHPVEFGSRSTKVARRGADGCWRYLIDA
jgi:ketosteroid isomerase-like protein